MNVLVREMLRCFEYVPDKFKTPEMCANAVRNNVYMFEYVPDKFKTQEMCEKYSQKKYAWLFKYIADKFKTQRDL